MEPAHISIDPKIMLGKPVVAGTRITVELILEKMSYGASVQDLCEWYPHLSPDSIHAALRFASEAMRSYTVHSSVEVPV